MKLAWAALSLEADVPWYLKDHRDEVAFQAAKAYEALNGRDFDGNTVKASFLPAGTI